MNYRDRDPPLSQDDIIWASQVDDVSSQPDALFFPSGFAWYFDEEGEKRGELTKYGWTGIHRFVDEYGVDAVRLQFGIAGSPTLAAVDAVVELVRSPTTFDRLGGMASVSAEEAAPVWPEAWLWINGDAWYFDSEGTPLPAYEDLGWQGLHRYLERCDPDEFRYRIAATVEDTALADPATAETVRKMVQPPE